MSRDREPQGTITVSAADSEIRRIDRTMRDLAITGEKVSSEDLVKSRVLQLRKRALQPVVTVGSAFENALDTEATFPDPRPLSSTIRERLHSKGLTELPVLAFPVQDPEELEEIVDGRRRSPLVDVFPRVYLQSVLNRKIQQPHTTGYHMFIDSADTSTPLSRMLGIKDLHNTSMAETNQAIQTNEQRALRRLDVPIGAGYIRVVTAKELLLHGVLEELGERVTDTRYGETSEHVVFRGKAMDTIDHTEPGQAPRLAVVLSNRPDHVSTSKNQQKVA